jgi:hypothetical protein
VVALAMMFVAAPRLIRSLWRLRTPAPRGDGPWFDSVGAGEPL